MKLKARPLLREVKPGRETLAAGLAMPRHRHMEAYALVVVQGALEQVSYAGRAHLRSGDMLVQPTLDWPDQLARDLAHGRVGRLRTCAQAHGIQPETVSRGFTRIYGVGPAQFARELKVRAAWLAIARTRTPFAAVAADTGFADQAHMTRSVKESTGASPRAWRDAR